MKPTSATFLIFALVTMTPILARAADTNCVKPEENQKLLMSAAKGDQSALDMLQRKNTGGDFCAKFSLGAAYAAGAKKTEGEQLKNEALAEYQVAAEKGDAEAQYFIGQYASWAKQDMKSFLKWELRAAEGGHAEAQRVIGEYYAFNGVEKNKDETKGLKFLTQSADQGNERAMFVLGNFYDQFEGKNNDFATAAKWYIKSAEKGFQVSYHYLADMYAKGEGLPQSWQNSYFWGCLSTECFKAEKPYVAGLQISCPPSRDDNDPLVAKGHLSNQEIEQIKIKASEWKPGTPLPTEEPGFFQKLWCRLHTPC